jgi:hypothetical protein
VQAQLVSQRARRRSGRRQELTQAGANLSCSAVTPNSWHSSTQLRAQLPEPRAPGGCLGGHSEGTPFEVARQPAGLAAVLVWQDYRRGLVAGKETPRKDLLTTISKLSWYGSGSEP